MTNTINALLAVPSHMELMANLALESESDASQDGDHAVAKPNGSRARKGKKTRVKKAKAKAGRGKGKAAGVAETIAASKAPRVPKVKVPPFELSEDDRAKLAKAAGLIRKDADNTFDIGAALADLQPSIPEKSWGKVIKPLGLTTRSAWNYMSVSRSLGVYRADLVNADIGRTVLYQLARAPEALVEVVLEAHGRGERLGVSAVKRMADEALGIGKKEAAGAMQAGGLSGIRKAAMEKLRTNSAELIVVAKRILATIDDAIATTPTGRRISRPTLIGKTLRDFNQAHSLIEALAMPSDTAGYLAAATTATSWGTVKVTLAKMCYEPNWPSKGDFEPWLKGTVVPVLRFVIFGEALTSGVAGREMATDEVAVEVIAVEPDQVDAVAPGETETPRSALMAAMIASQPKYDEEEPLSEDDWREAMASAREWRTKAAASLGISLEQAPEDDAMELMPTA